MSNACGYMNDLSYATSKVELDDPNLYQPQEQAPLGYVLATDHLLQGMNTFVYTQQEMNDSATVGLSQQDPTFYATSNSDMVGSCTTPSQQRVPPVMTGSSSSTSNSSISTINSNNIMMTALSSPSNWSPSISPTSTSSVPLTSGNTSLVLPHSSDPSFLSPLSPHTDYTSNQSHPMTSSSLGYSSPMPYHHYPSTPSPTYMPRSQQCDMTPSAIPNQSIAYPIMTTSASAPTTMSSANIDSQHRSPVLQQSPHYQLSPQPMNEDAKDQDTMSLDQSQIQSNGSTTNNTELRRQIHIQSEQKRRAQIKDGFEDLRNELPSCLNKKMSKVALLHRTVQHIQHLKSTQVTILGELERLMNENDHLRKFQENFIQRQNQLKNYHNNPM